jgi:hypothetical protein
MFQGDKKMKAHKTITITIAIAVALGLAGAALAACITNGVIPDVDIHTHEPGDIEYASEEAFFGCTNIPYEWDECKDQCGEWQPVPDDVDILWEATAGSFKDGDNEGSWVTWIAPASAGNVTLTATADDDARWANDTAKDDSVTIEVVECDDSVNYTVGERCETCEWEEADQFFPYCGTPKYVKVDFNDVVACGLNPAPDYLILKQTATNTWGVLLYNNTSAGWSVNNDANSTLGLDLNTSCIAFTDDDNPVCSAGTFTNVYQASYCYGPGSGACGYGGTADVTWGPDIDETAYCAQDLADPCP